MKTLIQVVLAATLATPIHAQQVYTLASEDGVIHFSTFGEGPPVLIINGGPGMSSEGFEPLASRLGEANRTILYDQRGTGKSVLHRVDTGTITLDLMVQDIEAIRHHLGLERWIVFGHSFGGMLAAYYTATFPERVRGLILSSSGGLDQASLSRLQISSKLTPSQKDSLAYWSDKIARGDTTYVARYQQVKHLAPAYLHDQSHVPTVAHRLTQGDLRINRLVFRNMDQIAFDCKEALATFTNPVLIVQGDHDVVSEYTANEAHRIFQNSEIAILKDCGHYGWLEQPETYFTTLSSFLERLRVR